MYSADHWGPTSSPSHSDAIVLSSYAVWHQSEETSLYHDIASYPIWRLPCRNDGCVCGTLQSCIHMPRATTMRKSNPAWTVFQSQHISTKTMVYTPMCSFFLQKQYICWWVSMQWENGRKLQRDSVRSWQQSGGWVGVRDDHSWHLQLGSHWDSYTWQPMAPDYILTPTHQLRSHQISKLAGLQICTKRFISQ